MAYDWVESGTEYKVVVYFKDHSEVYRTTETYEYEVREKALRLCAETNGDSWTSYRALRTSYMGQGPINENGSRTPKRVYVIIGWQTMESTRPITRIV